MLKTLIFLSLLVTELFAGTYKLDDIKNAAKINNFSFNALRHDQQYYKLVEKSKKSNFYPKFGVQAGIEKIRATGLDENEVTKSFYGELNLFNGLRDSKQYEISKIDSVTASERLKEMNLDLELHVEELFYRYLQLYHTDKILEDEIARNKIHLSMIRKRLSSSLVTESDLMEFELIRSKLDSKHEFLELNIKKVKNELIGMSGIKDTEVNFEGVLPHYKLEENLSDLLESMVLSSTKISKAINHINKAQLEIESKTADWMPRVDLKAEYGFRPEEETGISHKEKSSMIGVFAKWELFSGFSTVNEKKMAQVHKIKHEYNLKQIKLESELKVRSAFSTIKALEKRIDAEEKNHTLAKKLYKRIQREFQKGVKDSGDLASISEQLSEITVRVLELKKNYIDFKITLEKTLSRPVKLSKLNHK